MGLPGLKPFAEMGLPGLEPLEEIGRIGLEPLEEAGLIKVVGVDDNDDGRRNGSRSS